jgi:protein-L-isoaspartate(D-aspartate) O-methyltransferase
VAATALQQALGSDPAQTWTGIEVTATGELDFWLAGTHGIFRLLAGSEAVTRSALVPPAYADRIRAFDRDRAGAGSLRVEVHPATHPTVPGTLMDIDKRHTRVVVRTGLV